MACAQHTRTRSTPNCSLSSRAEGSAALLVAGGPLPFVAADYGGGRDGAGHAPTMSGRRELLTRIDSSLHKPVYLQPKCAASGLLLVREAFRQNWVSDQGKVGPIPPAIQVLHQRDAVGLLSFEKD